MRLKNNCGRYRKALVLLEICCLMEVTTIDIYRNADRPQRFLEAKNNYLSSFPRFALEALGIVLLAFMGGFMILKRGSASSVIPTLGSLALGSQRLLPALQQLYGGWASVKSCNAGLLGVLNLLNQPLLN